jgi:hypothetical protein
LAPSLTRTPRYSYVPPAVLQIATRDVSVVPKMTAVSGLVQRAVESTYPWLSDGGTAVGAAIASGTPRTTSAEVAAAAIIRPGLRSVEVFIGFHQTTVLRCAASQDARRCRGTTNSLGA